MSSLTLDFGELEAIAKSLAVCSGQPIPVPLGATDGRDTRNASYRETMADDKLPARRKAVLLAVKAIGPVSNRSLSQYLRVPVNQITGRIFELRQQGLVGRAPGRYVDPDTGKTVARWVVKKEGR